MRPIRCLFVFLLISHAVLAFGLPAATAGVPEFAFNYPDKIPVCNAASYLLKVEGSSGYRFRWYKNGVLSGNTGQSLSVTASGKYKVEVSDDGIVWFPSKEVEVSFITLPNPVIIMSQPLYCPGDVGVFSLNVPKSDDYTIKWSIAGVPQPALTDLTTLTNMKPGYYSVQLISKTGECKSKEDGRIFDYELEPDVKYLTEIRDSIVNICNGSSFKVSIVNKPAYQYRWYKDGQLNANITNTITITESGRYYVEATVCGGKWFPSEELKVAFLKSPPDVKLSADKTHYCVGEYAVLKTDLPASPNYNINWTLNGVPLGNRNNQAVIAIQTPGTYGVYLSPAPGGGCRGATSTQTIVFDTGPLISIQKSTDILLCDGQAVDLEATVTAANITWSNGSTGLKTTVFHDDTYTLTAKTSGQCDGIKSVEVKYLPKTILAVPDATLCEFTSGTVTLTAPARFKKYVWNGQVGGKSYIATTLGPVTLTVTDQNDCTASQTINISSKCAEITPSNTFTPNGDGINDTWTIPGIGTDPTATIKVYSRYGNLVFESRGYATGWNGQLKGKPVVAGTYYYIITTHYNQNVASGSVTVIY